LKNPFKFKNRTRRDDGIECNRNVKYDGKRVEITGLKIGEHELGGVKIEPQTLRTLGSAALLLDLSQYDLCMTIKNMKNEAEREKYLQQIADDKMKFHRIKEIIAVFQQCLRVYKHSTPLK
jgi:hypothetical protein